MFSEVVTVFGILFITCSADLWGFLKACQDAGLFVNFRIGPYACAGML